MKKFDFNIWNQDNSIDFENDDLPIFINTNNLFIPNKENINIIDVKLIDKYTRIDSLIFEKYGGFNLIEQFNIIKVILPLILLYNDINDITLLRPGMFLKLPEINTLIDNIYIYDEFNNTIENAESFKNDNLNEFLPGINSINKYNFNNINKKVDNKISGIPALNLKIDKITYNPENGIITY